MYHSVIRRHRRLMPRVALSLMLMVMTAGRLLAGPNLQSDVARPLHYRPEGDSFVVENGGETFNRPLYGMNTAFRVDGGDRPEFSLYLPGRGGNLRIGIKTASGAKWLIDADHVVSRYRAGTMQYDIHDRLLGEGTLTLIIAAMNATEGVVARVELLNAASPCEVIYAFGGANGVRGARGGDIGCEKEPVAQFFQLMPENCSGNQFEIAGSGFTLHHGSEDLAGIASQGTSFQVADAHHWSSIDDLLASTTNPGSLPVVVGRISLDLGKPSFIALQRLAPIKEQKQDLSYLLPRYQTGDLPGLFDEAVKHRQRVSQQIVVDTPDPFINSAVPAICVAADGIWDSQSGAYMHGAIAWRTKLLGWRGSYTGDELGQHDRTASHLMNWFPGQNVMPVDAAETGEPAVVPQDETVRLARNEPVLHTNGDLSHSHYDMNLPAIDVIFRHLLWTGDLEFARANWEVIERHLAWERRLFRREFGPDRLPLYEAYCCIWASDDLQYSGGGVTHASAYNYYHNKMAARVAKLIDKDPTPYEHEAGLILEAMHSQLWLTDRGWFAESKDLQGLQLTHPNAGLWTFYHTIDSQVPTPEQAWQMTRFVDTQMPHIPIIGDGVPNEHLFTLPTTTWMPYTWSTNNVVMAEVAHSALAYWQAGRGDQAFKLYKGCLIDSMFQGLCPGNVGMCTHFDMARGEAQRDFADGVGMTSRALVEGLFGVKPDALAGVLTIQPGFPPAWNHARIQHPDFTMSFARKDLVDRYTIDACFPRPMKLNLIIAARKDRIAAVDLNGRSASWHVMENAVGTPRVEIDGDTHSQKNEIAITWAGDEPVTLAEVSATAQQKIHLEFGAAKLTNVSDPQQVLHDLSIAGNNIDAVASAVVGYRSAFAMVTQGMMTWSVPIRLHIEPPIAEVYPMTDWPQQRPIIGNWDCIDLSNVLNDKVTNIFKNEYVSPRSPYCSLAMPTQGIGSWIHFNPEKDRLANALIDDTGLRTEAGNGNGRFVLPQGIPFQTAGPGSGNNIAFTSQWNNYPREVTVPLHDKAIHLYLLMAGSTNSMQSRFDNGEVIVTYTDGSIDRLALENPTTWWPIEKDYFVDDFAFKRPQPIPLRVDLRTGKVRTIDIAAFKGKGGGTIDGGAATVLDMNLDSQKQLKSLTVRAMANEVVIGLISATLRR